MRKIVAFLSFLICVAMVGCAHPKVYDHDLMAEEDGKPAGQYFFPMGDLRFMEMRPKFCSKLLNLRQPKFLTGIH
jgi:hypothetical protein